MSGRSEQIAATICEAILAHRLMPGTKLGERDLADIFAVSRVVIRQALIRLRLNPPSTRHTRTLPRPSDTN